MNNRTGVWVAIVILGIVGVSLASLGFASERLQTPESSSERSALPTEPRVADVEPSRHPTPELIIDVPAAIDATGGSDVTVALQDVIDDAPDQSQIRFPNGGRYRIDGTLSIMERRGLTIVGRGSTLFESARGDDPYRRIWRIRSSHDIVLLDLILVGAHPEPGTFVAGFEWQHGVSVEGGGDIELDGLTIEGVMGDCVYTTSDDIAWVDGVWIHDSSCHNSGRQGVAVVAGRNIRVERTVFGGIPLSVLDLEPEATGPVPQGVHGVVFTANVVDGRVGEKLLNATGVGRVADVVVEHTIVSGSEWGISSLVASHAGSPRYANFVFLDNVAEGAFVGDQHAVLLFADVDHLVIRGNRQVIEAADAAIRLVRVCDVVLQGNALGPVDRIDEDAGPCS